MLNVKDKEYDKKLKGDCLKFDRDSTKYIDNELIKTLELFAPYQQLQIENIYAKLNKEYRIVLMHRPFEYIINNYKDFTKCTVEECLTFPEDAKLHQIAYIKKSGLDYEFSNLPTKYITNVYISLKIEEELHKIPIIQAATLLLRYGLVGDNFIVKQIENMKFEINKLTEYKYASDKVLLENIDIISKMLPNFKVEKNVLVYYQLKTKLDQKSINKREIARKRILKAFEDEIIKRQKKLNDVQYLATLEYSEEHTLEQVGKIFDVSRERVRQLESKAITKLLLDHKLKSLYNPEYLLGLSSLAKKYFEVPKLDVIQQLNLSENINNDFMLNTFLPDDHYKYYDSLVKNINRLLVCKYLEKNVHSLTHIDEIEKGYIDSIKKQGIFEKQNQKDPIDEREIEGLIERSDVAIKSLNHRYRFWKANNLVTELHNYLDKVTMNVEEVFSTKKIYNSEFSTKFDINDHAELHYIMKKTSYKGDCFTYKRTPHIGVNNVDTIDYLYKKHKNYNRSNEDFLDYIVEITGMELETISVNYLSKLEKLIVHDILSKEELVLYKQMEKELDVEIMSIEEINDKKFIIYLDNISTRYKISGSWLLDSKYSNLVEYIKQKTVDNVFKEEVLGYNITFDQYKVAKSSMRAKRQYFTFETGYLYLVEPIREMLSKLDDLVFINFNFPTATNEIINSEIFENLIIQVGLKEYIHFPTEFWVDYLVTHPNLISSNDRKKLSKRNQEVDYYLIFGTKDKMHIEDYRKEFKEHYKFEMYKDAKTTGLFVRGSFVYREKSIYLNEMKKYYEEKKEENVSRL